MKNTFRIAEEIMLQKFRTEPFHNFHRLKETAQYSSCIGGTCSDKTLSYLNALKYNGINAFLHTAIIKNKFNHQLVRVEIDGQSYFADVGNGWPSIYMYPAYKEVSHNCFGMRFRTEIEGDVVKIYHSIDNKEDIQMKFNRSPQRQTLVNKRISNRFNQNIIYPFDRGLRFSMIVEDKFMFVRDNKLFIYTSKGYSIIDGIMSSNIEYIIKKYFKYNLYENSKLNTLCRLPEY